MLNYFKRKKELREKQLRDSKIKASENLALATTHMITKPCAVNDFKNCDDKCVHFCKGQVLPRVLGDGYCYIEPRCKLWR